MRTLIITITLLSTTLLMGFVQALEPLKTAELASHCSYQLKSPKGKEAIFCVQYIHGFIDGVIATNEQVVSSISIEETFTERAMRTRIGRIKPCSSTYYSDFCVGKPSRLKEVVNKVIQDLESIKTTNNLLLARDAIYQILQKKYHCNKEK